MSIKTWERRTHRVMTKYPESLLSLLHEKRIKGKISAR
jgi:hypothetical protein